MSGYEKVTAGLSIGNTVWLTGLTIWVFKRFTSIDARLTQIEELNNSLTKVFNENSEHWDLIPPLRDAVRKLNTAISDLEADMQKSAASMDAEAFMEQFELLIAGLKTAGVDVENVVDVAPKRRSAASRKKPAPVPTTKKSRRSSSTKSEEVSDNNSSEESASEIDPAEVVASMRRENSKSSHRRSRR